MAYRFSGHESFHIRYSWLPKAIQMVARNPFSFADLDNAMVTLGLGKNMVLSLRFWMQVTDVIAPRLESGYQITDLGVSLFGEHGFDPYLEDIRTLWLIHWKITTQTDGPLFAWDYIFNKWMRPEVSRSEMLKAFRIEADKQEKSYSDITLEIHSDVFLRTYVANRGIKNEPMEDNLDCPLAELELFQPSGERKIDEGGRRELLYALRREDKPEITPELFLYCLDDFRRKRHAQERTLTLREVSVGHGSPGSVFLLPEWDVRRRLENIDQHSQGKYRYVESAGLPTVLYLGETQEGYDFLSPVYPERLNNVALDTAESGDEATHA